jgi:hypothetical protein
MKLPIQSRPVQRTPLGRDTERELPVEQRASDQQSDRIHPSMPGIPGLCMSPDGSPIRCTIIARH